MAQELLVNEQIEAGAEFVREFDEYASVVAAFWINPAESDEWFLYTASDEIDRSKLNVAYGEVRRILGAGKSQWIDPFRVKLIPSSDPIAREAIRIRDRYPAQAIPTRYNGSSIGGMSINGAYIYPPLSELKPAP
ncbi:MAG: hypothetical protein WD648_10910 [Planctomycetaceae bacterium]